MCLTENEALEKVAKQWDKAKHYKGAQSESRQCQQGVALVLCRCTFCTVPQGLFLPIPTRNFEIPAGSFGTFMVICLILRLSLSATASQHLCISHVRQSAHHRVKQRAAIGHSLSSLQTIQ
ncbi:hypothetical protein BT93_C0304 [Corymbia citriodora subsp. variegata]|nr:hypothetical protein BT93_C0304 [Corymbia citriodora subsp. variegata]